MVFQEGMAGERPEVVETDKDFHSRVSLGIFRHGDKAPGAMSELERPLSEKGRQQAGARAGELRDHDAPGMVFGSQFPRSRETAARMMFDHDISDKDMQAVFDELNKGLRGGTKKIGIDERLGFTFEGDIFTKVKEHVKQGTYVKWLVEESDDWAAEHNDKETSTYSRFAANVAEILKKYLAVAPRFDSIVSAKPDKYGHVMQRLMGSHQGVGECFLAKLIEKVGGKAEQEKFLAATGNGFSDVEGLHVDITTPTAGAAPDVRVSYEKKDKENKVVYSFDEVIPPEILDEMIAERA